MKTGEHWENPNGGVDHRSDPNNQAEMGGNYKSPWAI